MAWVLGVDTGAKGAAVLIDFERELVEFVDMGKDGDSIITPEVIDGIQGFREIAPEAHVFVEKVHAFPGQSAKTTWAQACMYSQAVLVVREAFGVYSTVSPITWKKALGLTVAKGSTTSQKKWKTIHAVNEWWPWIEGVSLAKHDGRADAVCIAWYGLKFLGGGNE